MVQNAIVARNLLKLFISSLGATLLSGTIGVTLAYGGYGVWALVGQQLTSTIALCFIMWFSVKWRPKLLFSLKSVRELFSFSWKLLVSGLIGVTYNNLSSLIIGKIYPASALGYYTKGKEFPQVLVSNINSSIHAVMFPAYAKNQDNKPLVKQIMRRALTTSAFLIFPAMAGLAAIADPLIELLLTEKWLMSVPFLQIFCAVFALWPITTVNLQVINALGRSDIFLRLEIAKKSIGLCILAITVPLGIYAIALGMVANAIIGMMLNIIPNKELLDYSFTEQWKDLMPAATLSIVMCGITFSVLLLEFHIWTTLILQVTIGIVTYLGLAWLLKVESLTYVIDIVREYVPIKKPY